MRQTTLIIGVLVIMMALVAGCAGNISSGGYEYSGSYSQNATPGFEPILLVFGIGAGEVLRRRFIQRRG